MAAKQKEIITKEKANPPNETLTLNPLELSLSLGGFELIESCINGTANLNPQNKGLKDLFLGDDLYVEEREKLKERLELWVELIESNENKDEMIRACESEKDLLQQTLKKNIQTAIEASRPLEQGYRTLQAFYTNTEETEIKNVSILNADLEQLTDLDDTEFRDLVSAELKHNYDRLDLRDNYSLLVLPGFLKNKATIESWAKTAHQYQVVMVSDFINLPAYRDVAFAAEKMDLAGGESFKAHLMLTCNWLVGRPKYRELEETEHLYIPPSAALAGKLYGNLQQVSAGKKFGTLAEVSNVRFPLKKSEIAALDQMGLIPMVWEFNQVMAFSAKNVFRGSALRRQVYSIVRVEDWILKVLMDFLNRRTFENIENSENDIRKQIDSFLANAVKQSIAKKLKLKPFSFNHEKGEVAIQVEYEPIFPAKVFPIELIGTNTEEKIDWSTN